MDVGLSRRACRTSADLPRFRISHFILQSPDTPVGSNLRLGRSTLTQHYASAHVGFLLPSGNDLTAPRFLRRRCSAQIQEE
jgi:hypothetical protein